ncbi:hypothetical protein NLG97_g10611 [Lecanicillium saksenae]|uniref:Uncharacterized protein n=1 Tax=Lecanicillium saksenae TaxID=468837 RepID=A0ACC1QEI5_9HYPO|nr:hypothetical protein NLG97_g10611 [Lecanicillium saksenae]
MPWRALNALKLTLPAFPRPADACRGPARFSVLSGNTAPTSTIPSSVRASLSASIPPPSPPPLPRYAQPATELAAHSPVSGLQSPRPPSDFPRFGIFLTTIPSNPPPQEPSARDTPISSLASSHPIAIAFSTAPIDAFPA